MLFYEAQDPFSCASVALLTLLLIFKNNNSNTDISGLRPQKIAAYVRWWSSPVTNTLLLIL